jgi:murein DD-endopeptidase MepM/ murein hydrolase activator NlpD
VKTCINTAVALCTLVSGSLAAQSSRLSIAPASPDPGAVVRLTLSTSASPADSIVSIRGALAGEPLHFIASPAGAWHALGAVPVDAEGSLVASVYLTRASGKVETVRARLALPKLPPPVPTTLAVDKSFTRPLDSATAARVARENLRARAVGSRAHDSPPMWTAAFQRPRSSIVTSEFGTGRLFNGHMTSRHLGVDFRGAVGQPVNAANRGVVALVDNFFLAGNVVYINHGAGVVTGYFHLSKTLVAVGDTVERGQQIGLVGATGRVTGPHLHWSARYGTITVNPLDLVALDGEWYAAPRRTSVSSSGSKR